MDPHAVRERLHALRDRACDVFAAEDLPPTMRTSAVLLLLWEHEGSVQLALTRRGNALRSHAGDVALPGGTCEAGESPTDAALRETEEEIGVRNSNVVVCGRLDDAWSSRGHRVVPIVGWHEGRPPDLRADGVEVAEVIVLALDALLDPSAHHVERVPLGPIVYDDDVLRADGITIRGMTADILVDLLRWLDGIDRRRVAARLAGLRHVLGT